MALVALIAAAMLIKAINIQRSIENDRIIPKLDFFLHVTTLRSITTNNLKLNIMIDKITKFSAFAIPYAVAVSFCFQIGYWQTFNIDFYSYITAIDVISLSIFPLFVLFIVATLSVFSAKIIIYKNEKKILSKKNEKKWNYFFNYIALLCAIFFIFIPKIRWYAFMYLSLIGTTYIIINFMDLIIDFNKNIDKEKLKILFFSILSISLIPVLSFSMGKISSYEIINGTNFRYIERHTPVQYESSPDSPDQRYVGKLGEYIFIYLYPKKYVIVENINNMLPFRIHKNDYTKIEGQNNTSKPQE